MELVGDVRNLVLDILQNKSSQFKKHVIARQFRENQLRQQDKAFIIELVNGVIRHRYTLDYIINHYSQRMPKDPIVKNSLAIGLYQLLYMHGVPEYAVIATTVELLKDRGMIKPARYANGLLRNIQRQITKFDGIQETANSLPVIRQKISWLFKDAIFPDPNRRLTAYRAAVYSYPLWWVNRWHKKLGKAKALELLCAGNSIPPIFLRIRKKREQVIASFLEKGIGFSEYQGLLQLERPGNIESLPGYDEGHWVVSGPTAVEAIMSLTLKPGMKILDLCAAPGGKSLHMLDRLKGQVNIVACDISPGRLDLLKQTKEKLALEKIEPVVFDACSLPKNYYNNFDVVVVDAPCSNSGVLAKRIEARWRLNQKNIENLQKLQWKLLQQGSLALKSGGQLLYSTCSLESEENECLIEKLQAWNKDFEIIVQKCVLPLPPQLDGGTFCKLTRRDHG